MLKDSFSLTMKVNKALNQFRRNLVKPSLPQHFVKLVEKVEESSEWLFGVSLETTELLIDTIYHHTNTPHTIHSNKHQVNNEKFNENSQYRKHQNTHTSIKY